MLTINKDILTITEGVIIHQVNNKHVMGAGLAKGIRSSYPQHYSDYMKSTLALGSLVTTHINRKFGIVGIVAQDGYGRDRRYTDYTAFAECLNRISAIHSKAPSVQFYMPLGIGCGLAGGDWNTVLQLIKKHAPFIILVKK